MDGNYRNIANKSAVGIVVAILLSGCASSAVEQHKPRYLGYRETFTQNGKSLMQHGASLTKQSTFEAKGERDRTVPALSTRAFPVQLAGFNRALVKQSFTSGSFESNFGHETELIFSFQPCHSIEGEPAKLLTCIDQPAATATVVSKKITLVGGQKLAIQFPQGVEWTYEVLDQASPIADE